MQTEQASPPFKAIISSTHRGYSVNSTPRLPTATTHRLSLSFFAHRHAPSPSSRSRPRGSPGSRSWTRPVDHFSPTLRRGGYASVGTSSCGCRRAGVRVSHSTPTGVRACSSPYVRSPLLAPKPFLLLLAATAVFRSRMMATKREVAGDMIETRPCTTRARTEAGLLRVVRRSTLRSGSTI